jgi:hypothetical protein
MIIYKIFVVSDYYDKEIRQKLKRKGYKLWKKEAIVANRQVELWRKREEILDKPHPFGRNPE